MLGSASLPEDSAVGRGAFALEHVAAAAGRVLPALYALNGKLYPGVKVSPLGAELYAGILQDPDASPSGVAGLHHFLHQPLGGGGSFFRHHPGIAVDEEGLTLLGFGHADRQGGQDLLSRKAGHDPGYALCQHVRAVLCAGDGVDMAGIEIEVRRVLHGLIGGGHGLVGGQDRKVLKAFLLCLLHGQAGGGSGGLKAHRQETYLGIGMLCGIVHGIHGGIDHLYRGSPGPGSCQAHPGSRHPDQVPEGADGHALFQCQIYSFVDKVHRRYAYGAAGAGDQLQIGGKKAPDAQAEDLVGVGPADLHDPDLFPAVVLQDLSCAFCLFFHKSLSF